VQEKNNKNKKDWRVMRRRNERGREVDKMTRREKGRIRGIRSGGKYLSLTMN
jgi:hypothetical protein